MKQRENAEAIMFSDDPLQVYLTLIRQVPALDDVEESLCIEHVRANDQQAEAPRTRLVEANLQLVVSVAERYSSDRIHILDLIEKGNGGLLRAVESLHACCPDSFAAHAMKFILPAIAEAASA